MRRVTASSGVSLLTIVVGACVVAASSDARAQSIRAAALAPQFKTGASTPELRDKFHDAVVRGLGSIAAPSGPNGELGEVLSAQDTRTKLGEELLTCGGQAACLGKALAALKVNRLVGTELTVAGKTYTISMRLYDGQGHELTHADDLCEICTVREADEAVTRSAARLAAASRTFPVEAVPGLEKEKAKEAAKPAPRPQEEPPPPTSTVSPMQPPPAPPPQPVVAKENHRHFPWRAVAFGSLGLGIVGLAIGIPLVVIDGRPTCDAPDPTTSCPEVYNTAGGGATMLAIGALGLAAAVPLFYFDYRDRHRSTVTSLRLFGAPATSGGGTLTLQGRF